MINIKTKENPKFSENIKNFCDMVENAKKDYKWNEDEINRLDHLTQDYLHKLELEGLSYSERAKVATQLKYCRQLRRQSKDTVEILSSLIEFFDTDKGSQLLHLMKEVLGKTRKSEKIMENRHYRFRVLEEDAL